MLRCKSIIIILKIQHQVFIKYAVSSPQVRLHLSYARQKIAFLLCIAFGLH